MNIPHIKIQLVHLAGPLKGEIQEYCQHVITLGRHPECQVIFPKDYTGISRKHAEIRREGNRFKLIDQSTNGTFVNGKQQSEVFLKNGDVLVIGGKKGAKVSFLTQEISPEEATAFPPSKEEGEKLEAVQKPIVPDLHPVNTRPAEEAQPQEPIPRVTKTFIVQHGTNLASFRELPIIIGKGDSCDCTIQHSNLLDRHAELFFRDNQYWVKDLTGRALISVNMQTVKSEAPLRPDGYLEMTPTGPKFLFLGEGRLAEVDTVKVTEQSRLPAQSVESSKIVEPLRPEPSLVEQYNSKKTLPWVIAAVLGCCLIIVFLVYFIVL